MDYNARLRQRTGGAILNESSVAKIKRNLMNGVPAKEIAEAHGVGVETIRRLARGETWTWVRPEGEIDLSDPPPDPGYSSEMAAAEARLAARFGLPTPPQELQTAVDKLMDEAREKHSKDTLGERLIDQLMGDSGEEHKGNSTG